MIFFSKNLSDSSWKFSSVTGVSVIGVFSDATYAPSRGLRVHASRTDEAWFIREESTTFFPLPPSDVRHNRERTRKIYRRFCIPSNTHPFP